MKMRELTRNEKRLLTILALILIGWGSYHFILTPQHQKLEAFNLEKLDYQTKIDENSAIILKDDYIDESLEEMAARQDELASNYFPKLDQAEVTYLLNDLLEIDSLEILDMNISMPEYEEFEETQVKKIEISLAYQGDYLAVIDMLNSLENSPRKIIIESISMDREDEDSLWGDIALKIYALDDIVGGSEEMTTIYSQERDGDKNPFSAFSGYVEDNYYEMDDSSEFYDFFDPEDSLDSDDSYDYPSDSDDTYDYPDDPDNPPATLNSYSPQYSVDYEGEKIIPTAPGEEPEERK